MNMFKRIWRAAFEPDMGEWWRGFALIKKATATPIADGAKSWDSYSYELRAYDNREKNFMAAAMQELLKWASEHVAHEGVEFRVIVRGEHQCDLIRRDGDSEYVCLSAVERVEDKESEDAEK